MIWGCPCRAVVVVVFGGISWFWCEHPLVPLLGQGGAWALLQLLLQDVTKFRDSSASVSFGHSSVWKL